MIVFKRNVDGHYVLSAVSLMLFLSTLMYLVFEMNANRVLAEDIKIIKLGAEINLSEKLALEKEIKKLKSQLILIERGYEESNQTLAVTFQELDKTEKALKIQRSKSEVTRLRKQNSELLKKGQALEIQLSNCKALQDPSTDAKKQY